MSQAAVPNAQHPTPNTHASPSPGADAWRRLRRNPVAIVCGLYILLVIFVALFANSLAPYVYDAMDNKGSLPAGPDAHHLLGGDGCPADRQ